VTSTRPEKASALELRRELKLQATLMVGFVGLLWAIELVDQVVFRGALDSLGIRPRSMSGLYGIPLAPLLHGGFGHLAANTVPLIVLGWMVMLRETRDIFVVTLLSTLVGGAGVWLVGGAATVHVGASILIFGYLGYLLLRGWFDRGFWSMAGSILVALLYGGLVFGVLPGQPGISWEGHLFGFAGGVLAARLLRRRA
jgi:membrane associated rhomboid family serine protease